MTKRKDETGQHERSTASVTEVHSPQHPLAQISGGGDPIISVEQFLCKVDELHQAADMKQGKCVIQ